VSLCPTCGVVKPTPDTHNCLVELAKYVVVMEQATEDKLLELKECLESLTREVRELREFIEADYDDEDDDA
jgi:hypothetical protein